MKLDEYRLMQKCNFSQVQMIFVGERWKKSSSFVWERERGAILFLVSERERDRHYLVYCFENGIDGSEKA